MISVKRISIPVSMTFVIWICTALILFQSGCKNNPVDAPIKNPREYTWTIDTIAYPGSYQTLMQSMWVNNVNDIYMVGHNSSGYGAMYHYDGNKWNAVKLFIPEGGTVVGGVTLDAICGFSSTNVFAVGVRRFRDYSTGQDSDSSLVIHFDGTAWRDHLVGRGGELQSVWGSSSSDIWAGGFNTLLHYDGVGWRTPPVWMPPGGNQFLNISGRSPTDTYLVGVMNNVDYNWDTTAYYLYHFDGAKLAVVDSSVLTSGPISNEKFGPKIQMIDGALYSVGNGVYRRANGQWQRFSPEISLYCICGMSGSNILVGGLHGTVLHYDGSSWYEFPKFEGMQISFTSMWMDADNAILLGQDDNKTYVLHGK